MAEPSTTTVPTPTLSRATLRLVLFGMPDAGKSSLLGALAQAAQSQEHLLNGHLTDTGKGLAELQRRLYDEQPRETLEEIVPHPIVFEPFVPYGQEAAARVDALLVDCDGRVANELLARRRSLLAAGGEGTLAQAILDADTLVLVIDASAAPTQVDADFKEFGRFLRVLQASRGRRSDVGGLPVFLVLTKCDLLAQPDDTPAGWIERIESRKREVDARFQEFLARPNVDGPVPFGHLDLHLWATAVKRPALEGSPAKPREPYGVAELFRQAFDAARVFRQRRLHSGRRLLWTLTGSTAVVAAMATVAVSLLLGRGQQDAGPRELLNKIASYQATEPLTPSNRLREPLQPRLSGLTDLRNDPDFSKLPQDKQDYVNSRLEELQEYQDYKNKLFALPGINTLHTERALDELEVGLNKLALPEEHKADWSQTEANLYRAQRLLDVRLLRQAVSDLEDWYRRLQRRGEDLWAFSGQKSGAPIAWPDWLSQMQSLLDEAEAPPHRPGEKIVGSSLEYEAAYRFDRVVRARADWDRLRQRMQRVANLGTALGLAGSIPGRSPLDLPAGFTVEQAAARLQELEKAYPHYREEFNLTDLPEATASEIRRAADLRYQRAIEVGQAVVLRHLQDANPTDPDTPENWRRLRSWLANPEEFKSWRVLATVLAGLRNAEGGDPVTLLDNFLRQPRFDLVLRRLIVELPDERKLRPGGQLAVHHRRGDETLPTLNYELLGEERHDARRQVTSYTFQPTAGVTLAYQPGDSFWVDLPVKRGDEADGMLTWAANRSQVFQFQRLLLPPRLHRKGQPNLEGERLPQVTVEVVPEGGIPQVPDLLPTLPLT
jgi:hypothetical protein